MIKRLFFVFFFVFLAGTPRAWATTAAAGILTMDFDLSHHPQDKEVRLWIPYPVSSPHQDITGMAVAGDFAESAVYTDKKFQTPMLYARWAAGAESRRLTLAFKAVRAEVSKRDLAEKEAAWNQADFAMWLTDTSLAPLDGPVAELAARITKGQKTVLAKAKAIYDWTCANMYRDPATIGCGPGDVCALLQKPGGKCTDIHSVFVALCRAAGVPAREIFGIRLGKNDGQDISSWQHCWAEFYLPGQGWVPVDPADVRKLMLQKNLTLDAPETVQLREYFWGGWDAYRVKLAVGRDLVLNPPQHGAPLNTFGYPYAEVDGEPLDFYNPATFRYTFTAHKITKDGFGVLDTAGLKSLLDRKVEMAIFDARNPEEYQEVHVRSALNLPQKKFDEFAHLLPKNSSQLVIFYCNGVKCGKSKKAAKKALSMGYENVLVYDEGMPVWEENGLPIYAGPDYEKRIETTKITAAKLNAFITSGAHTFQLVDVRDAEEFAAGHIPGSINIPLAGFASQSAVLDKNKTIIVYCNSGGRSYNAYRKLMKLGYETMNQAIFADWKEQGFPVELP
jgi:rhodanese-related sulfurtransferase/transglutaminase-like putative cysteine protease